MAEVVFEPQQPFVVDSFKNCEGLGRVAIMEGASVIMLGKVTALEFQSEFITNGT
jgi:elongation factor 1-alpha